MNLDNNNTLAERQALDVLFGQDSYDDMDEARDIFILTQTIFSDDVQVQLEAMIQLRKLLSKEINKPIEQIIQTGAVPRFIEFLAAQSNHLQFEATWVLTNIASGTSEQTGIVLKEGAVPHFIRLFSSRSLDVRKQAVWALGNIAGDGPVCRDYVLSLGALRPLLNLLRDNHNLSLTQNAAWTLGNLCKHKNPPPDWKIISPALSVLKKLLYMTDETILVDVCWSINSLMDGHVQEIMDLGVSDRLIELSKHESKQIQLASLRCIGSFVFGSDEQTQKMVDGGVLESLHYVISKNVSSRSRKEACWALSNIAAGTSDQVQAVIDHGFIQIMLDILQQDNEKTKKEACWAICNILTGDYTNHMQVVIDSGCIKPLCDMLGTVEEPLKTNIVNGLNNITNRELTIKECEMDIIKRNIF